jgi:thiol:disulfide interchange protein
MSTSRSLGWIAGALAIALAGSGCATKTSVKHAGIAWNTAFDAALTDAGKTGRPILLDFYTDW